LSVKPFKAVIKGNANVLDSSVTTLIDVSAKGLTPLHIAAEKGGARERQGGLPHSENGCARLRGGWTRG
jgi:hypothetical protein